MRCSVLAGEGHKERAYIWKCMVAMGFAGETGHYRHCVSTIVFGKGSSLHRFGVNVVQELG